ncbi:UNC93-like protein 1 [Ananas comosus]|uniref:UNC93-like protein 1 n=1 Tax=Ananas comosus TaxID=4615 RepID=A0A6P5ES59_ANACO|nr:UNC93-like protein 1 [Ananas comosus]
MERSEQQEEEEQKQRGGGGGGGSPLKKEEEEEENGGRRRRRRPGWLRHNSPLFQVVVIGVVCFCCPGMFNALSGMGGGGQLDHRAANNANTALYAAFSVTLLLGCSTYSLYAGSFLYYNHHPGRQLFTVVSGGVLGAGAGLLWSAQGAVVTSSPPPRLKASYFALFWAIFNTGGVLGGLLPFLINYSRPATAASLGDATYVAFVAFMACGALLSLAVLPPSRVVRDDGSRPSDDAYYPDARAELLRILRLFADRNMLLIAPAAWASNFFYTYQFNHVNGDLFDLRTRGLNNVFYWGAQMLGSAAVGYLLDFSFPGRRRRLRGFLGIAVVAALGTAVWAGGIADQRRFGHSGGPLASPIDFRQGRRFGGPFVLYFSYGLLDAMFQTLCYWVIGALADDSQTLSRYSGFYKGVQSAGAAVAWQIDTRNVSAMSQLIVNWSLTTISYPLLAVLVALAVKDETSPQDAEKNIPNPPPSAAAAAAAAAAPPPSISVGDGGEQGNNREAKSS